MPKSFYILFSLILTSILSTACKSLIIEDLPKATELSSIIYNKTEGSDSTFIGKPIDVFKDSLLMDLFKQGLKANNDVLIAIEQGKIAESNLKIFKSHQLPTAGLNIGTGIQKFGDYTMTGVGNFDTNLSPNISQNQRVSQPFVPDYLLNFQASWEIDFWGKYSNYKMAGKLKVINSELIKQVVSSNLIAKIALLYYDLISADNQLLILRQNILLQEQALETIKYQKEIGLANQLAVDRLLGQQNNFLAQEPIISNKIKQLENQLNLLLGKPSGEIRREGRIEEPVRINSFDTIPINLLKNRPDIVAAENNLKASGYLLKSARADFFPSIALNLNFGLNSFNIQSLLNLPASIAGGVFGGITNPIINRKVLKNNFLIKNAERRISWFEYQKLILEGFLELSNLINYEKSISEIIVLKKQEVEILKSASTISKDLLINGKSNYLELISAQQAVLNAEMELNSLKAEQLKNKINFYRALGGGAF